MRCFYCGNEIAETDTTCPFCQVDQKTYHQILNAANVHYNWALEKAEVRDLSGAISHLNQALKFNKYHIDARNLLGLCYFEVGDMVLALREWVISKNFQPENNVVDLYLKEVQNPGTLDKMSNSIKKYNQAIEYINNGSRDLAKIQLRRVVGMMPRLVKAHQLLALLALEDGDLEEARKELNAAAKIDSKNTRTLRYIKEVKARIKEQEDQGKKTKKKKNDVLTMYDGNEMIVTPKNPGSTFMDNSRSGILNILIGAVLGALVIGFLVIPTIRQNANSDAANELVAANEEVATTTGSVDSLKTQVADLKEELAQYTDKAGVSDSYEKIIQGYNDYNNGDFDKAYTDVDGVNEELLGDVGKLIYDSIIAKHNEEVITLNYNAGYEAFNSGDYENAIKSLQAAADVDVTYDNGKLCYYLAESYANAWQFDKALEYYQEYIKDYPNGKYANRCQSQIETIEAATNQDSEE